ncbi:MAG: hypothetical protein ACOYJG_12190 [Prevotella sp.]
MAIKNYKNVAWLVGITMSQALSISGTCRQLQPLYLYLLFFKE